MKKIIDNIAIFLKGFCMGVADVIPGVSGGTVAFLMGIYEELIESISSFNIGFLKGLAKGQLRDAFSKTGWKFILILLSGILSAIFSLSHPLKWLLTNHPVFVHAFFFGIILTTIFIIFQKVQKKSFIKIVYGLLGAIVMFQLTKALPMQTPETWWFLFLSGVIAICAMILPGISGAFILLLLGKYEFIITAVSERNFSALLIIAMGCITGLLTFVHLLRWLLKHHHDLTLSVLSGVVAGSLFKIWPWKEILSCPTGFKNEILAFKEINTLPPAITPPVIFAFLFFVLGIFGSLWLAQMDRQRESASQTQ
ncbi:MAG: DUF368 domain-containing protein [Candidatus Aceula meridiana]|nr:DUF368 domain-containing protein [Candidatus Aceula meridiana]